MKRRFDFMCFISMKERNSFLWHFTGKYALLDYNFLCLTFYMVNSQILKQGWETLPPKKIVIISKANPHRPSKVFCGQFLLFALLYLLRKIFLSTLLSRFSIFLVQKKEQKRYWSIFRLNLGKENFLAQAFSKKMKEKSFFENFSWNSIFTKWFPKNFDQFMNQKCPKFLQFLRRKRIIGRNGVKIGNLKCLSCRKKFSKKSKIFN